MNRRRFLKDTTGYATYTLLLSGMIPFVSQTAEVSRDTDFEFSHRLPVTDGHYQGTCGYVEDTPVDEYTWAPPRVYEEFLDMKFGIRVHWGLYSILQLQEESWPFLKMQPAERQMYQQLYKSWNPSGFNAAEWVDLFKESGAQMFSFTTKHHDGFSMYDTSTKVKSRTNWVREGGPGTEDCDVAYSIMDTPFKRDVVAELTEAAHKKELKIDLYFSHPDWYDADFRPYTFHPLQVPSAAKLAVRGKDRSPELKDPGHRFGKSGFTVVNEAGPDEVKRMMLRHRAQLEELITRYGKVDMVCLDMFLGPDVWPELRKTMLHLRSLRPNVMFRARGIGNYGDYYTPEGFIPGSKENTDVPWFVIYPLGGSFSFEPVASKYKGAKWIVKNLVDSIAKGGNFMAGIGPDGNGLFHPEAIKQLKETGAWIRANQEGIYGTRAREGELWKEGEQVRFTRSKDNRNVYAFALEWPGDQLVLKTVRARKNSKIIFMATGVTLKWRYEKTGGIVIELPQQLKKQPENIAEFGYGFKIEV
jgi:alpha-L-fucosidase